MSNSQQMADGTATPIRLYVLDCGVIGGITAEEFGFAPGEIGSELLTPTFLIVHPDGVLLWDTGLIPDEDLDQDGPTRRRSYTVNKPLLPQLKEIGYTPDDITYLALSHYHNDHVANANAFAGAHWLVQRAERDVMFAEQPDTDRNGPIPPNMKFFGALRTSRTTIIENRDFDVFGDGAVMIKFTPGHTPGHQSLFVRLQRTGPILISGDLYHFPAEVNRGADFVNHADNDLTSQSRRKIEAFVEAEGATLWIQHDIEHGAAFCKAPEFYD